MVNVSYGVLKEVMCHNARHARAACPGEVLPNCAVKIGKFLRGALQRAFLFIFATVLLRLSDSLLDYCGYT